MMFSASVASAISIFSAVLFAMPISGTHTVVGALIGAGLSGVDSTVINWAKLGKIVASWFISPALSMLISFMFFTIVCWLILNKKRSQNSRLIVIAQLSAFSFLIMAIMIINLLPSPKECIEEEGSPCAVPIKTKAYYVASPLAYIFGLFLCRSLMVKFSRENVKPAEKNQCCDGFKEVICFWQNKLILSNLTISVISGEKESETGQP
jgi:phosphate/sulfate permease